MLLHQPLREHLGISLNNSIVIIDEAHNLLDSINSIHSAQISGLTLARAYSQLTSYKEKYESRFRPQNLARVKELINVLHFFLKFLKKELKELPTTQAEPKVIVQSLNDFQVATNTDTFPLHKLLHFCTTSEISKKVRGFTERQHGSVTIQKNRGMSPAQTATQKPASSCSGESIHCLPSNFDEKAATPVSQNSKPTTLPRTLFPSSHGRSTPPTNLSFPRSTARRPNPYMMNNKRNKSANADVSTPKLSALSSSSQSSTLSSKLPSSSLSSSLSASLSSSSLPSSLLSSSSSVSSSAISASTSLPRLFSEPSSSASPPPCGKATATNHQTPNASESNGGGEMFEVQHFLEALTNVGQDGRVAVALKPGSLNDCSIKYLLLNPSVYFKDILAEARTVVVAGGTLQPFGDFVGQLVPLNEPDKEKLPLNVFTCDHVIPANNLLAITVGKADNGQPFEFRYEHRSRVEVIDSLGKTLIRLLAELPKGVVVFFPSYVYADAVLERWNNAGVLKKMEKLCQKAIFREVKGAANAQVFHDYVAAVKQGGAILFCVVGGKMSEGINFKDDLGRGVIMVGLPYPNVKSPELLEQQKHLSLTARQEVQVLNSTQVLKPSASQDFFTNICMKAVNQSIGRAIRHAGDFACIVLIDQRYTQTNIKKRLPGWIRKRLEHGSSASHAAQRIRWFFADKRQNSST
eukprot:m.200342 g.200342  ORF g.200342 m.200342 type:complete len:692 (+) comp25940_c0_seq5:807-2882(+)